MKDSNVKWLGTIGEQPSIYIFQDSLLNFDTYKHNLQLFDQNGLMWSREMPFTAIHLQSFTLHEKRYFILISSDGSLTACLQDQISSWDVTLLKLKLDFPAFIGKKHRDNFVSRELKAVVISNTNMIVTLTRGNEFCLVPLDILI